MSAIKMHKYHGLGNDYLIFDPNENGGLMQERKIEMLCRRNFGLGADGILYGPLFEDGRIKVGIYNSDGSQAESSGNGVRIFAKYLKDAAYVKEQKFSLTTKAGDAEIEFLDAEGSLTRVNMGKADFMSALLPGKNPPHETANESLMFHGALYNAVCLSLGSPNCVIMTEDVSCQKAKELGPYVENAEYFSGRMNLELCRVCDRKRLKIENYERGSGYTLASGTGACAAAAAAYRMGLTDRKVTVEMPGGSLWVEMAEDGSIYMTGPVEKIGTFTLEEDFFS